MAPNERGASLRDNKTALELDWGDAHILVNILKTIGLYIL